MQNSDLETHYQLIVAIRKLATAYHDAAVEKMDHVFFKGRKIAFKPQLIEFLKSRLVSNAINNAEWTEVLTNMGYDSTQINDFDSIVLNIGQLNLPDQLGQYAQRHPEYSIYTAINEILKNYENDPIFGILAQTYNVSEDQVLGLFGVAYHYLDSMYPVEVELNLLNDFYEPSFDHARDRRLYAQSAKIIGKLDKEQDEAPPHKIITELANQYVLLRTNQLRQYVTLDLSKSDIRSSLQAFHANLVAEVALLDNAKLDETTTIQLLQSMTQPEIVWLEAAIVKLELSNNTKEKEKGAKIRAAYTEIPVNQRADIVTEMQKSKPSVLIGRLKQALDQSTSQFAVLGNLFTNRQDQLSLDLQEKYKPNNFANYDTDSESDSHPSGRSTPNSNT